MKLIFHIHQKKSSSDTFRIFDYDEERHYFYTNTDSNPWLCIEFKNHKTNIRSSKKRFMIPNKY